MSKVLNAGFLWLPAAFLFGLPSGAHAQANPVLTSIMRTAPMTLSLNEEHDSRMSGTVTLTLRGDSTAVRVTLQGARAGESVHSHIHYGTCENPGGVVAPLADVLIGSDGTGMSRTIVARSLLDEARKAHGALLVQAHLANGKPAACADVPAR